LLLLSAALPACGSNHGSSVQLVIARGDDNNSCVGGMDISLTSAESETTDVRFTVESVTVDGTATVKFECDEVLPAKGDPPPLKIPSALGDKVVNIHAEAFQKQSDGTYQRIATGALYNLKLIDKPLAQLRLYRTGESTCANGLASQPRAFHSATRLSGGQVLLVGGVIAADEAAGAEAAPVFRATMNDANRLFVTGTAEVYDPRDGAFHALVEDPAPMGRAFHRAVRLTPPGPGREQVLLVGGVTPLCTQGTQLIPCLDKGVLGETTGLYEYSRVVGLIGAAPPFPALALHAAPAEILEYDTDSFQATRTLASAKFPRAAFPGAGGGFDVPVVTAGGVEFDPIFDNLPIPPVAPPLSNPVSIALPTDAMPTNVGGFGLRWAPTVSVLQGGSAALVWGGGLPQLPSLTGTVSTPTARGMIVRGIGQTTTVNKIDPTDLTPQVQFHAAVEYETPTESSVLIAGGFLGQLTITPQPPALSEALKVVSVPASGPPVVTAVSPPMSFVPTGWLTGTSLPRGRALLTGGAPDTTLCPKAPTGEARPSLWCAIDQATVFDFSDHSVATLSALAVPRLGHSATLLEDGTVLIVGGINLSDTNMVTILSSAEVLNPRTRVPVEVAGIDLDDPVTLPPNTVRSAGKRVTDPVSNQPIVRLQCTQQK
jgi:hypothetical protein